MSELLMLQQKRLINIIKHQLQGAIDDANEALKDDLTDDSEGIYQGRLELAEHLLELINTNEELDTIDRLKDYKTQGELKWVILLILMNPIPKSLNYLWTITLSTHS